MEIKKKEIFIKWCSVLGISISQYFLFINHPLFDKHQAHLDLRVTDVLQACGEGCWFRPSRADVRPSGS